MKIGVIAELLRKPLNEDLDFAGQELKVDGVQLYAQHPEGGIDLTSCTDEELKDLQEKCRKNNNTLPKKRNFCLDLRFF